MSEFIHRKLQVFVSSTFTDLVHERQAAVEAILTAGHIPAGMELFTAGDESQMEVIKRWIDESDVFMLILGGRYGSIESTSGKSYTQLEYEYAAAETKPLFACVIQEQALDDRIKEQGRPAFETVNPQLLRDFRAAVLTKMTRFWVDTKDIKIAVSESLAQIARRKGLIGWVRPSTESNVPALANEIARLSKENAELRQTIQTKETSTKINGLSVKQLLKLLTESALDFLFNNKNEFATNSDGVVFHQEADIEAATELCLRGLLRVRPGSSIVPNFVLTEGGSAFINQYEAGVLPDA